VLTTSFGLGIEESDELQVTSSSSRPIQKQKAEKRKKAGGVRKMVSGIPSVSPSRQCAGTSFSSKGRREIENPK
jgi:hypothetical protein